MTGLLIPQNGGFFGFSIQMSVVSHVCWQPSSPVLLVPFLNWMENIQQIIGWVRTDDLFLVRVGGKTPESAVLVATLANNSIFSKDYSAISGRNNTPPLDYIPKMLYTMGDSLGIVSSGQTVLGDYLSAFQAGSELDLYTDHGECGYTLYDYDGEIDDFITQAGSGSSILKTNDDVFPDYLNHTSGQAIVAPYTNIANTIAQPAGKPFIMFETSTTSCEDFTCVSNTLDYAMTIVYSNFTGPLFHAGGQNAYYNLFKPPPTNQSSFKQWSVGATYYSALVMVEVLGPSNASELIDLGANDSSIYTPGYAIYENGTPTKLALFNYITGSSGASEYTATVAIGGSGAGQDNPPPSSVRVKHVRSSSVADIQDFTWAGQTFGASLASDGRLTGDLDVQTVQCDTSSNTCQIKIPAPSFALVFLTDDAYSSISPTATETFPTTVFSKTVNTLSIEMSVLKTWNGHVKSCIGLIVVQFNVGLVAHHAPWPCV
ncbi:uncharacterized protein STEHIDRAFT_132660 [Stereum hirsutum FP-91666 SS1]|uniref:uncharacterized protein n=1 Tax=Stereum hirsutum (strain FP-91666) TaxID=721885 RepID=UPI0004449CC1|nr:uncharacterized protein STEHIDRAFT_132660 [Stereum hirsutum FP-91666 SS1]EIM84257.1 hypothetical protein STEHIDRAFT_132660 [Stereum hirsutum FP-91666 SS1]